MQQQKETSNNDIQFCKADLLLILFLLPLYFAVWGRFGQKFAAGAALSIATGACCWLVALIMQSPGKPETGRSTIFGWPLFVLFPLFCPLALPLWLIPFILIVSYLVVISSFGGFGKHFFNPVALAVVFMLCGYGATASLNAVRPLADASAGFKVWSAGLPPARPLWQIYTTVPTLDLVKASCSGSLPSIPGNAFGMPLLAASFILSFMFGRRRLWWLTVVVATAGFTSLVIQSRNLDISPLHPLLLGVMPGLLLIAVADFSTLPESGLGQMVSALIFAAFAVLFIFKSENILSPVYALLLMQIVSPLVIDVLTRRVNQ